MNWRGVAATFAVTMAVMLATGTAGQAQEVPKRGSGGVITLDKPKAFADQPGNQPQGQPSGNIQAGPQVQTGPLSQPTMEAEGTMAGIAGDSPDTVNLGVLARPAKVFKVAVGRSRVFNVGQDIDEVVVGEPSLVEYKILKSGRVFLFGRTIGSTNIFMLSRGRVVYQGDIFITIDPAEVQAAIKQLMPNETIEVEANRQTLFLTGSVRSPAAAANAVAIARRFVDDDANIVNLMKISSKQQVILRVKVAEIKRSAMSKLSAHFQKVTDLAGSNIARPDQMYTNYNTASPTAESVGRLIFRAADGGILENILDLLELSAQADEVLVRTLAEPTLTAISGETAVMLSGSEVPVPATSSQEGAVTYEFIETGVSLAFTPVVNSKRQINLQIATEVSSLTEPFQVSATLQSYGRNLNKAETTVDLPSGGSIMIAGLLQQRSDATNSGVPGLKDVPVVGNAFGGKNANNEEYELVIIVTAYIAQPVATQDRLAAPTDGFEPADDVDLLVLGKLHKVYSKKKDLPPWAATLKGPYGYVLE